MKNLNLTLMLMTIGLWAGWAQAQTHHVLQSQVPNDNTAFTDVISFDAEIIQSNGTVTIEKRTIAVGQRSIQADMSSNAAAIIVCFDASNQVLWQREVQPTISGRSNGYTKVIKANNGDIVAVGYLNGGANFATGEALISKYSIGGLSLGTRSYQTGDPSNPLGGDVFYDVVQDPTNNNLYTCGSRNTSPNNAQSTVASINYNTLVINWYAEYVIPSDAAGIRSDQFTTLGLFGHHLHVFGIRETDPGDPQPLATDSDIVYLELDAATGTNMINFQMFDLVSGANDCNWPVDFYVDQNTGNFLLTSSTGNDFVFSASNTHFVLGGTVNGQFAINNVFEYRDGNGSPMAFENNIAIQPLDINNGDFILVQSPGTLSIGSSNNLSVSATNPVESVVSTIAGFTNVTSSVRMNVGGRQWLSGIALHSGSNELSLVGSSFAHPNQNLRDAYLFSSQVNIQPNNSTCPIVNNIINIIPSQTNLRQLPRLTTAYEPILTERLVTTPNLLPVDLCQAPCIDSLTTVFDQDTTISINTIFHGRYYVAAGVTITVAPNVELDLTNVDMVFDICAGIDVLGRVRANNSVFRPCDDRATWKGIRFFGGSHNNYFNESTIKNAEVALYFERSDSAKINSNTFINCKWGIYSSSSTFSHPITNNNLVRDDHFTSLSYNECNLLSLALVPSFMEFNQGSNVNTEIFGNKMSKYGTHQDDYYGIFVDHSFVKTISSNTFSNLKRGVYMNGALIDGDGIIKINNNQFERQNESGSSPESQIQVENSTGPIEIESNTIKANSKISGFAIDLINSRRINVSENTIEGFEVAIGVNSTRQSSIVRNKISQPWLSGINVIFSNKIFVKCNTIDLDHSFYGILNAQSANNTFESNCILNSDWAGMIFAGGSVNSTVLNNYLYSYSVAGIYNVGEPSLNLGTNPGVHGQNTFWSNSNAADIFTGFGQSTDNYNNFGVSILGGPGTTNTSGPASVNSTATCGHQIYNLPSQFRGVMYPCKPNDVFNEVIEEIDIIEYLQQFEGSEEGRGKAIQYYKEQLTTNRANADAFYAQVENNNLLNSNDLIWLQIEKDKFNQAYDAALFKLKRLKLSTKGDELLKCNLEIIYLEDAAGIKKANQLTEKRINELKELNHKNSVYYNSAAFILSLNGSATQLKSTIPYAIDKPIILPESLRSTVQDRIKLYPNPAKSSLNIQFSFKEENTNVKVIVLDMMGKKVMETKLLVAEGNGELDIASLSSGSYIIQVIGDQSSLVSSFIKQ